MALGSCHYRTVKNILAAGQDHLPPGAAGRDDPDAHAHQHPRRRLLRHEHHRGGPMLIEQTLDKLNAMKLGAMADAVQRQLQTDAAAALSFEERFGLLVDVEWTAREQRKLAAAASHGQAAPSGHARGRRLHSLPPAQPPAGPDTRRAARGSPNTTT